MTMEQYGNMQSEVLHSFISLQTTTTTTTTTCLVLLD